MRAISVLRRKRRQPQVFTPAAISPAVMFVSQPPDWTGDQMFYLCTLLRADAFVQDPVDAIELARVKLLQYVADGSTWTTYSAESFEDLGYQEDTGRGFRIGFSGATIGDPTEGGNEQLLFIPSDWQVVKALNGQTISGIENPCPELAVSGGVYFASMWRAGMS